MGKYFGTDGVRGIANSELTPELAFKLGRCGGYLLTKAADEPKVVVGRDTRISGELLESALIAGLLSIGVEVMRLGVISTPGVAYLTRALGAQAGVMISASHNPVADNGIKFFDPDGFKLTDEQEAEIEALLDAEEDRLPRPTGADVGIVSQYLVGGQKYIHYLKSTVQHSFEGLHIVLDCAHGAASALAPQLFCDLGAQITTIGANPNGVNINDGVGSTQPEALQQAVLEHKADLGLAFDGDADRLIAVDEQGNIVNGDQIMYVCALAMKEKGQLKADTVVATVMSNMGFYKALEAKGIQVVTTKVGDRYVLEEMLKKGYNLGGEQSGHIIFLDYNTTGDGMLSALQLVNVLQEKNKPLSALVQDLIIYPQKMVNVRVKDKHQVTENEKVKAKIAEVEREMNGKGRVLVRPSGTEPLVRVMVEAEDGQRIENWVNAIADVVREEMGNGE
ncbi:phosphoglucosamine mutase [Caldalkalibacillus thermarum TA2.A1]|uniref:Phosphoglucosamine mutase n=1 Tax=Caldalkalibacillus thermarum (strain TA2.A1) TaxID=986075 RepID=A0A8X8LB15_CALTT|nr:phosphoglucosamine mutase [Caldalkalibacillus thermarum]QZT34493.1 phosphoglucosamine mutase [Caldalkalibacillus thermarum TA2.A1]